MNLRSAGNRISFLPRPHLTAYCGGLLALLISLPGLAAPPAASSRDTLNLYGGPATLAGKFQDAAGNPDPQGWGPRDYSANQTGSFGQLWVGLDDNDPEVDNHSPQWAFIDDGIIVPGTGPSYCTDGMFCYGPDQLVTNPEEGAIGELGYHYCGVESQPIALPGTRGQPILSFDAYVHNGPYPFDDPLLLTFGLEATSDPEGIGGWSYYTSDWLHAGASGDYRRITMEFTAEYFPDNMKWVKIRLSAYQMPSLFGTGHSTPGPYVDNVRLQWLGEAASPAPMPGALLSAEAWPNPFNPSVTIRWRATAGSRTSVRVHDLTGRLVATLFEGVMPGDQGEVVWHGKTEQGQPAAAGVYLCRIEAGDLSQMLKLMLVK